MRYLYVFLFFSLLSLQALPARAQTASASGPIISEINWAGSSLSQADEWIELYNPTGASVDLSGWILTGSASSGEALAISDGTILAPGATLLIANYEFGNEKSTLALDPDLVTASLSLSNSAQQLMLAMPDGTVVDSVGDGGKPQAGTTDPIASMERNPYDLTWSAASISSGLSDVSQLGTPGSVAARNAAVEVEPQEEPTTVVQESEIVQVTEPTPELTAEQLANCYALYMPQTVRITDDESPDASEPVAAESNTTVNDPVMSPETVATEPTSGEETATEPPTSTILASYANGDVLINEVVSNPADGNEWIELSNASETIVNLTSWTITEGSGRSTTLPEDTLAVDGYLIIESIKGNLNNDGDILTLKDSVGNTIDTMSYDQSNAPNKGESLARAANGIWSITNVITRGSTNAFPEVTQQEYENIPTDDESSDASTDSQAQYETISDVNENGEGSTDVVPVEPEVHQIVAVAKTSQKSTTTTTKKSSGDENTKQSLEGIITAAPGTFGSQIAFIDGMQLYFYHADWPELSVGDYVQVNGEPSIASGETRLKIAAREDITILGSESVEALAVSTQEARMQDIGSLVQVSGSVTAINGKNLTLSDDAGEITVVVNERTGMNWGDLSSSAYTFTGVIRTRDDEVELYVRDWQDVAEVTPEQTNEETDEYLAGISSTDGDNFPWIGTLVIGTSTGAIVYWLVRYKYFTATVQT